MKANCYRQENGDYEHKMNKEIADIMDEEYKRNKSYLLCEDCFEEMHQKYAAEDEADGLYPNADSEELEGVLGDL